MDEFLLREFEFLLREQRKEFVSIMEFESDLDLAYRLQMEEAMVASLALQPSSSSQTQSPPLEKVVVEEDEEEAVRSISNVKTLELDRLQTELKDREECEAEMKRVTEEMKRRVHDQKFASEILAVPEREWRNYGEYFENPFGEGSSSSTFESVQVFKLYFKGLIVEEKVEGGLDRMIAAIGVAICDPKDNVLLRIQKPLIGDWKNHRAVDLKALIEGLNAAIALNIRRVHYFCVNRTNYLQIAGRWKPKQRNIIALLDQVFQLESKFETCETSLVAGNDLKYAFKLAKDAIDSQFTKSLDSSDAKNLNETCSICLEDNDVSKMFAIDGCLHRYCFSCMKQHMEVKLLHGMVPACPHEGCDTKLSLDTCKKFLPPKLVEMMGQLKKEASIPVTEKIYCPYPKCSILMSKAEALEYANNVFLAADRSGVRKCIKCHGLFCINCKVPWHSNMNCHEYKRSNLSSRAEEAKLKSLANQKLWRQCVKCNHMIELAEGCYHMTCRCGYEFCYTCGAEWKNKKQTCSCKLWDEDNILYDDDDGEDENEEDDYFDDEYEEDYESDDLEETRWRYFFAELPMA